MFNDNNITRADVSVRPASEVEKDEGLLNVSCSCMEEGIEKTHQ